MKVFISQPMNGKTDKEILEAREHIIGLVRNKYGEDAEIIDSFFDDYKPDEGNIPLKYLAKSIEMLADADLAVFGNGWSSAGGCSIELQCATNYGIPVVYQKYIERT